MSTEFRDIFEATAPRFVAAAWDFVDRSPAIDTIWIYLSVEESVAVDRVLYRVGDQVLEPGRLDAALPALDTSIEAQTVLQNEFGDLIEEFFEADEEQIPVVTVMRFRTADHDFSAEFSYEPLRQSPADEEEPDHVFANRWAERVQSTGDGSLGN